MTETVADADTTGDLDEFVSIIEYGEERELTHIEFLGTDGWQQLIVRRIRQSEFVDCL